jgi:hypothetical protein
MGRKIFGWIESLFFVGSVYRVALDVSSLTKHYFPDLKKEVLMSGIRQKRIIKVGLASLATGVSLTCFSVTEYKRERYDLILDRSPFGADPLTGAVVVNTDALDKAAAAAAVALGKNFRLSFLLESQDGDIRAGFQNLKPKKGEPSSSIIMVGESFMGMKLKSIDFFNSEATMEHNGKPVSFQLSKAPVAKAATKKPVQPQRRFGGGFRKQAPAPVKPKEPELSPEEQRIRREEIRANLQDYQMEVIRSGMPPLPIPLTPEMDDQLVAEGILPPGE